MLLTLIRKGGLAQVATATPATLATQKTKSAGTVAEVATVAVASRRETPESTMAVGPATDNSAAEATREATEERIAITEYDGGLTRPQAEKWGRLAEAFYNHIFGAALESGCCYAPNDRYCAQGKRLRDEYYASVN